jgi:hypothetical protein
MVVAVCVRRRTFDVTRLESGGAQPARGRRSGGDECGRLADAIDTNEAADADGAMLRLLVLGRSAVGACSALAC